jgi:hypothetical protein
VDALDLADPVGPGVLMLAAVPPALDDLLKRRVAMGDAASEEIARVLQELMRKVEPRVRSYLRQGDPRGIIQASDLADMVDLLRAVTNDAGRPLLETAQQEWVDALGDLAAQVVEDARAAGITVGPADMEAITAATRGQLRNAASAWDVRVVYPMADRMLSGLTSGLLLTDPTGAASWSSAGLADVTGRAVTELRTETAAFDRVVAAEVAVRADPTGDDLRWIYSGPRDGLQRPFCEAVHDLAWTRDQVSRLDNGQRGASIAAVYGGGYNCRHQWAQVSQAAAAARGLTPATEDDVTRVNLVGVTSR